MHEVKQRQIVIYVNVFFLSHAGVGHDGTTGHGRNEEEDAGDWLWWGESRVVVAPVVFPGEVGPPGAPDAPAQRAAQVQQRCAVERLHFGPACC